MSTKYSNKNLVRKDIFESVPNKVVEKQFILDFLKAMPLDKLKKLVSFEEIDFENKQIIEQSKIDANIREKIIHLRQKESIEYYCELIM